MTLQASTLRATTLGKLSRAMDHGEDVSFDIREARLAGFFEETAIGLEDIDEEDIQEEGRR